MNQQLEYFLVWDFRTHLMVYGAGNRKRYVSAEKIGRVLEDHGRKTALSGFKTQANAERTKARKFSGFPTAVRVVALDLNAEPTAIIEVGAA